MEPVNVLHILATRSFGGAEKVVLEICENLNPEVYHFSIVCAGGILKELYERHGLKVFEADVGKLSLDSLLRLYKHIHKNRFHILHAHDNRASLYAYLCKVLFCPQIKIISHVHSSYPWLKGFGLYKLLDRIFRNRYRLSLFCGSKTLTYYQQYGNIDARKARVVANSVRSREIDMENSQKVLEEFGLSRGDFVCCLAGRLSPSKGWIPFIERLSARKDLVKSCKFILVGEGELYDDIKKLINEKKLQNAFFLAGFKENILDYIGASQVLILPSLYEGLPMVVLEAMSLGKPVIAFDVGSLSDAMEDGYNGFLISPFEYGMLLSKILYLKEHPEVREKMGSAAKEKVQEQFSMNKFVAEIEAAYHFCISAP